jgi:hypothetical protein
MAKYRGKASQALPGVQAQMTKEKVVYDSLIDL